MEDLTPRILIEKELLERAEKQRLAETQREVEEQRAIRLGIELREQQAEGSKLVNTLAVDTARTLAEHGVVPDDELWESLPNSHPDYVIRKRTGLLGMVGLREYVPRPTQNIVKTPAWILTYESKIAYSYESSGSCKDDSWSVKINVYSNGGLALLANGEIYSYNLPESHDPKPLPSSREPRTIGGPASDAMLSASSIEEWTTRLVKVAADKIDAQQSRNRDF